jgi:hypothetical protein
MVASLPSRAGPCRPAGGPPFEIEPPSEGWSEVLYGFGWLRICEPPIRRSPAITPARWSKRPWAGAETNSSGAG